MTELEDFIEDYERKESDKEMYFSLTYIPYYYQEENEDAV
mgnify:CR=1 FL=1